MKKQFQFLFIFLFISSFSFAQNDLRVFEGIKQNGNNIIINVNDGKYEIKYYSTSIVETSFIPKGQNLIKESHAVILEPIKVELVLNSSNNRTVVVSKGISLDINHKPFQISYSDKENNLITSEKRGYFISKHEPMDFVKGNIVADKTEKIEFNLTKAKEYLEEGTYPTIAELAYDLGYNHPEYFSNIFNFFTCI